MPTNWPPHTPNSKAKSWKVFATEYYISNTPPAVHPTAVMSDGLDIDDDFLGIEPDPEWDDEWEDDDDI